MKEALPALPRQSFRTQRQRWDNNSPLEGRSVLRTRHHSTEPVLLDQLHCPGVRRLRYEVQRRWNVTDI